VFIGDAIEYLIYFGIGFAGIVDGTAALGAGLILLCSTRKDWKEYKSQKEHFKSFCPSIGQTLISLSFDF
jgi:hypothetical protein